jgi:threonine/homoserine/homoserine lactone efflux protein
MPTLESLALFAVASAVLILIPGPAVLYIVARSIHQGRKAGLASVLGIEVGSMVHIVGAALGLSAILVSSSMAFSVVKFAGAAYLIYLGIRTLLTREEATAAVAVAPMRLRRLFAQGAIVNVLNPKVALFFFAFFPQFIDPGRGSIALQTLVFGAVFCAVATTLDCTWALLAGSAGTWLKGNAHFLRRQRFVTGAIYLGLGVTTAFAGHGKSK